VETARGEGGGMRTRGNAASRRDPGGKFTVNVRIIPAARFLPPPAARRRGGGRERRKCQICISGKRERGGAPRTASKSRYAGSIATVASFRRFYGPVSNARTSRIRDLPRIISARKTNADERDETRAESSLPRSRYRNYLAIAEKKSPPPPFR